MTIMRCFFYALLSLPTLAAASDSVFNGAYIGAQTGFVYTYFKHQSNSQLDLSTPTSQNVLLPVPTDDHASNLGPDIGLHMGYGHTFKWLYLGAEINGDLMTSHVDAHSISTNKRADVYSTSYFDARVSNNFGINFRPGVLISPRSMLFLEGGIQRTHLSGSSTAEFTQVPDQFLSFVPAFIDLSAIQGPHVTTLSGSDNLLGWQAGFGYEIRANNHFSFRVEELISGYQSIKADTQTFYTPTRRRFRHYQFDHPADMKIQPFVNSFLIGGSYYFN